MSNNSISTGGGFPWGQALGIYSSNYPQWNMDISNNVLMGNLENNSFDFGANYIPMGYYYVDSIYWGTTNLNAIRSHICDFHVDPGRAVIEPRNVLDRPPSQCHGVVWKVLINGQNPQTQAAPMVVSGRVKFEVYFNRPMDASVPPFVTFGVRTPYTQNVVNDSAAWSADSTVWTGYHTATLQTGDGENTVRIAFARDTDHFEIPVENSRFKFVVKVAGSASIDFTAIPGVGKVYLEWHKNDSLTTLGYNIYRYQMPTDTTYTDTMRISSELVTDSTFNDYNVIHGQKYFYLYTIVGTDLLETDYSKSVFAIPFAAANGDANGDGMVNVLDITSVVAYMLNQEPQPFLFDAADINNDNLINVLDVVGIVNVITGKKKLGFSPISSHPDPAYIYLEKDRIRFRSEGQVSALQFELSGQNLKDVQLISRQKGFEFAYGMVSGKLLGILYNLRNEALPQGMIDLIIISGNKTKLCWGDVTGGDPEGQYVLVLKDAPGESLPSGENQLQAFPNPFNGSVTLTYTLNEDATVKLSVVDMAGGLIRVLDDKQQAKGSHSLKWDGKTTNGEDLPGGVYVCKLQVTTVKNERIQSEIKLIIAK